MLPTFTVLELSPKPDNLPDIRTDNRIGFKLSPVLENNNIHNTRNVHANQLNIKEVYSAGYPAGYSDRHQNQYGPILSL